MARFVLSRRVIKNTTAAPQSQYAIGVIARLVVLCLLLGFVAVLLAKGFTLETAIGAAVAVSGTAAVVASRLMVDPRSEKNEQETPR